MKSELWIEERHQDFFATRYRVERTLFCEQSDYQEVLVVESKGYGRMLFNDGLVMVSEKDEFIYHEMIAHVPLYLHPHPQRVLVIGGGDGGTVREVARHPSVGHCTLVEIDEVVVRASKEFLPSMSCGFDNPKVEVIIGDGVKFVKETQETFDVIIIDSTDPIGPSEPLFGAAFYSTVDQALSPGGIVVAQGESPFLEPEIQSDLHKTLSKQFRWATFYNYTNLTYPGGLWSFAYASRDIHPATDSYRQEVKKRGLSHRFYNADVHRGAFLLPELMKKYAL